MRQLTHVEPTRDAVTNPFPQDDGVSILVARRAPERGRVQHLFGRDAQTASRLGHDGGNGDKQQQDAEDQGEGEHGSGHRVPIPPLSGRIIEGS